MAKKKPSIELSHKKIVFILDQVEYKAILFKQEQMTIDCIIEQEDGKKKRINIPFAHIPKSVKKLLKPS